jgi:hypothetical protein
LSPFAVNPQWDSFWRHNPDTNYQKALELFLLAVTLVLGDFQSRNPKVARRRGALLFPGPTEAVEEVVGYQHMVIHFRRVSVQVECLVLPVM